MSLRIIGGSFRNRPLKAPKGQGTRPTLAIMRKAVFDILQTQVEGSHFLDLFAGTGAMSFEALSRGAEHATFIERDRQALHCIQENMRTLKVEAKCTLLGYDVFSALKKLAKDKRHFDIVYVDPPYAGASELLKDLLLFFDRHDLLNKGSVLFIEEAVPPVLKSEDLSLIRLRYIDSRSFSRSTLHQFHLPS